MTRIIGVDPGTWKTGVGVIEAVGNQYHLVHFEVVTVTQKISIEKRLLIIYKSLSNIIKAYRPEILALENIFYHKNIRSMIKIGEARACAMLSASEQGIGVIEYLPTRVKQSVTGNGRASKTQMQQMVKKLLGLDKVPPSDAADALAVAICYAQNKRGGKLQTAAKGRQTWKSLAKKQLAKTTKRRKSLKAL